MNKMQTGLSADVKSEVKTLNKIKGTMDFDQEQNNFKRVVFDHITKLQNSQKKYDIFIIFLGV